jgi:hypothetical protein
VHAACESLARDGQILRFLGTEAWPDGTMQPRFAFAHALYRQAAMDRIRPGVDRVRHLRIAARIEAGFGDKTEDVVAHIPARFASELAARFDVGEAVGKAARYYLLASERLVERTGERRTRCAADARERRTLTDYFSRDEPGCCSRMMNWTRRFFALMAPVTLGTSGASCP